MIVKTTADQNLYFFIDRETASYVLALNNFSFKCQSKRKRPSLRFFLKVGRLFCGISPVPATQVIVCLPVTKLFL